VFVVLLETLLAGKTTSRRINTFQESEMAQKDFSRMGFAYARAMHASNVDT
jgi:hypothetical protein